MLSFLRLLLDNFTGTYRLNEDGIVRLEVRIASDGETTSSSFNKVQVDAHHKNHPRFKGDLTVELYTAGNNINVRPCDKADIVGGPAAVINSFRANEFHPYPQTVLVLSIGGFFTVTHKILSDRDFKTGTKGLRSNQNNRPGSYQINVNDRYVGYEFTAIKMDERVFLKSRSLVSSQAAIFHEGPDAYFLG